MNGCRATKEPGSIHATFLLTSEQERALFAAKNRAFFAARA